jgi:hypothetical protein
MLVEGLLSGRALCIADADLRMWSGHPPSVRTAWAWRIVRIVNRYEAWPFRRPHLSRELAPNSAPEPTGIDAGSRAWRFRRRP